MTVIASWGGGTSNSYVDYTAANSYIRSAVVDIDAWTEGGQRKQEAALLQATLDIDAKQYVGSRYYSTQKLEFPRHLSGDYPWEGTAWSTLNSAQERMQSDVERAVCHQALWILRNDGRNIHAENIAAGIKSLQHIAGPVQEQYQYSGKSQSLCQEAVALLSPWMTTRRAMRG